MKVSLDILAAIYRVVKKLANDDGEVLDEEIRPLYDFLNTFEGMNQAIMAVIINMGEAQTDEQAYAFIAGMEEADKQRVVDLMYDTVAADDKLADGEGELFFEISEACGLPKPTAIQEDEEEEEEVEEPDEDDAIIPAFLVVNFYGVTTLQQSESEDWNTLGDEIEKWIASPTGVQVVRFTAPLNALSKKLRLNGRHLVFLMARNGYGDMTVGDNMPATLLYGGGYPLYGNIVLALETDSGYEIEGIGSRKLLGEVYDAVNEAVDGLLRTED